MSDSQRVWWPLEFLYTHNPFYAISAALVLSGVYLLFDKSEASESSWALLGALAGYCVVMALAGWVIVRLGRVWEDARSILILVIFLMLAMSASFDDITTPAPTMGMLLLVSGVVFSIVLCDVVLHGLRIRVPLLYLVPFYAALAFFFVYPLILRSLLKEYESEGKDAVRWGILAFPAAAGLLSLTLLPAIRRGRRIVADNGTPWGWPWFPWGAFLVLGIGVCARAYILTYSFDPIPGMQDTIFDFYFLVPFLLAVSVLLLEIGLVSRSRNALIPAMLLPLACVGLSLPGRCASGAAREFLEMFMGRFGSPVLWGIGGAAVFYVYAWLRKVRFAEAGVVLTLSAGAFVNAETVDFDTLVLPQTLPIAAIAGVQLWMALRSRTSARAFGAYMTALGVATLVLRDTEFVTLHGAVPVHLACAGVLVIGAVFRDRFAEWLQKCGAYALLGLVAFSLVAHGRLVPELPGWVVAVYVALMLLVSFAYSLVLKNVLYLQTTGVGVALGSVRLGFATFAIALQPDRPPGLLPLLLGGVAFAVALAISFAKGRIFHRAANRVRRWFCGFTKKVAGPEGV